MASHQPQVVGGRFALLQIVGAGGMGRIFKAQDRQTGKLVAVKHLTLKDPDSVARFEREAVLLSRIPQHPNIVSYIAHGREAEEWYLVMSWVEGETLGARIAREGLTIDETVQVGLEAARALEALHSHGLVHRDVKPANIMVPVGAASPVTLVDFGLVRTFVPQASLTRTGTSIGSPSYMAPEQAMGAKVISPAADVYSLACALYYSLTGSKAFPGDLAGAVEAKILAGKPPTPRERNAEVPPALSELVMKAMDRDLALRPTDGGQFAAQLAALAPSGSATRVKAQVLAARRSAHERTITVTPASMYFAVAIGPEGAGDELPSSEVLAAHREVLKRISGAYQANQAVMRDGSCVVVSKLGEGVSPKVDAAARCALEASQAFPQRAVVLSIDFESGDAAIDRAMHLLSAEHLSLQVMGAPGAPHVRVDEDTARYLGREYQLKVEQGHTYLEGRSQP